MPPTEDPSTSLSATDETVRGPGIFATTHWSVVLEAQGESPAAQKALEKLCRTYWRPIYGYVRRHGAGTEDAEDLTQGFFALLLERKDLNSVRKEKGRLRSYLLASVKHFLADESRRAMALKRGKGQRLIPFDDIQEGERIEVERYDRLTADQIYERRWALTVLEQVMSRLSDEYRSAGNVRFFDQMKKMLMDEPDRPSQAQVAIEFGMTENAVKQVVLPISSALPNVIARGNRTYRRYARRRRRRIALSDLCSSDVAFETFNAVREGLVGPAEHNNCAHSLRRHLANGSKEASYFYTDNITACLGGGHQLDPLQT